MNLYLIVKGYKEYGGGEPQILAYTEPQYRDEIVEIYEKCKDETIEPKIIEADSADFAISLYKNCRRQKNKQMSLF